MRLTSSEQKTLHDASLRWFGVPPRLFGSRVDDARRGGDIDLYIESTLSPQEAFQRETHMAAELYRALGERKIDIVVNTGRLDLPIYRLARAQGVWL
jgi:predicted nucleotidyltransferase